MATTKSIERKEQLYLWEGVNKRGERIKGESAGLSIALVKAKLRTQGINPIKVRKKPKPLLGARKKKIAPADIAVFSRQMATMLSAGIPLIQSFDIVGRGHNNPSMLGLVNSIKADVEAGSTLAEALQKYPRYFSSLFCNLVYAGEQSGSLEIMLDKIATYQEKIESIKGKIKKALFYPAAVMVVAFIVSAGLLIYVVPQFESLFKGFGADLPILTQIVIQLSEFMQAYWWIVFGVLIGTIWGFIYAKNHSKKFAFLLDQYSLRFPIIGEILQKAAIARFARTLSITFGAGMPLIDALKAVSGATGNQLYTQASLRIRDDVTTGQQLQFAMRTTNLFPNMVNQMVAIGEESGALEEMLAKVADFYEEEVDNAVDSLSSLLEPLIMAILGIIVGGLVIAMYLPIFKLGSVV
ncbi:MAG: type II secretion system F family protein [Gammaproteobacteria bacterium]